MVWGKRIEKKISIFYKGKNIIETLKNSLFGKIKTIITNLVGNEEEFKLPRVIVIGNESTGKSSLLENITKCQLFPRNNAICTKAPIHLILNNGSAKYSVTYKNENLSIDINLEIQDKNLIYVEIQKIMDSIPDQISEEEVIINITDEDMPTFEFFDLPGIRSYPPEMAEMTVKLCRKYLEAKDSIVMCVVPATNPRLTSCQSIALIRETGMEENCILALTMVDKLQEPDIQNLLIDRILMTSDEFKDVKFSSCNAVINRLHTDEYSLEESNNSEQKWFDDNIIREMPTDFVENKQKILSKLSLDNLLMQMDILYNNFIQQNWKPKILKKIKDDLANLQKQIEELGPELISGSELSTMLSTYIDVEVIPNYIDDFMSDYSAKRTPTRTLNRELYLKIQDSIIHNVNQMELYKNIEAEILNFFTVFHLTLKLYRFDDAQQIVKKFMTDHCRACGLDKIKNSIIKTCIGQLDRYHTSGLTLLEGEFISMSDELVIIKFIYPLLKRKFFDDNNIFCESEKWALQRSILNSRIETLRNYEQNIDSI